MAAAAVDRAMNFDNGAHHLHPFFTHKKRHDVVPQAIATNDAEEQPSTTDNEAELKDGPKKRSKRSKKQEVNGQRTILQGFGIGSEMNAGLSRPAEVEGEDLQAELEADPNHERRKRRKTASPARVSVTRAAEHLPACVIPDSDEGFADLDWHRQLEAEAGVAATGEGARLQTSTMLPERASLEDHGTASRSPEAVSQSDVAHITPTKPVTDDTKPTRTMHLKGGKLASPTAAKQTSPRTPRRGKRGKVAEVDAFIVKIDYGTRSPNAQEMGRRIQSILDSKSVHGITVSANSVTEKVMTSPAPPSKATGPPKATHPFFTGKPKKADFQNGPASLIKSTSQDVDLTKPSPRKASTTTPGKLRAQRDAFRMPGPAAPNFGVPAERKKLKYAGQHPAWPTQDNIHVRGLGADSRSVLPGDPRSAGFVQKSSKRKVVSADTECADDVLAMLAEDVDDGEGHFRHPTKLIITGAGLQDLAAQRLSNGALDLNAHPALHSMYQDIENELSAFDKYQCETKSWTHKYAPKSAAGVLQAGREAFVLKDWLQRSTITAVQTSSKKSTTSSSTSNIKTKKKRKRNNEDDFIVDSDDELDELNELLPLSDPERSTSTLKSVVRGGDRYEQSTPASTVLLSGPHGSGKTAAVYAVAKELGFEIFEINSASRRSGKDVIDKIGDMTENHLVQQVSKALTEEKPTDTNGKIEAIKIELPDAPDSKQKSMASFFKAGPATKKTATGSTKMQKAVAKSKDETKPKSRQKQSLILFEEVDVLFQEDKQFWLTVLTIASHSKRPIVMTCNDERYVPEAFTFHAILRFVPPPVGLATDYLLLMAAREGHVLGLDAMQSLYKTKGLDLRGSITELNFWCQMAVGDPTRGFLWMLDRYPPGVDLDAQGRTLRTVSQDTFVSGMNVISQDLCHSSTQAKRCTSDDLWSQAWDDWQIEVTDHGQTSHVKDLSTMSLDDYAFALDVLSAGDMSFGFCMRPANHRPQEPSTPRFPEKVVASHALALSGRPDLLQSELLDDYTCLDKELAITSHTMAMKLLNGGREDLEDSSLLQRSTHNDIISAVIRKTLPVDQNLTRNDFSQAFDVLAADPDDQFASSTSVTASSFDREFTIIATDLAPYIRAISHVFQRRDEERLRMSNLLSAGGRRRQTRNAFAAMDGGRRSDRRARYFETWRKLGVVVADVLKTGGQGWSVSYGEDGCETRTGTASGVEEAEGNLMSTQESDELH